MGQHPTKGNPGSVTAMNSNNYLTYQMVQRSKLRIQWFFFIHSVSSVVSITTDTRSDTRTNRYHSNIASVEQSCYGWWNSHVMVYVLNIINVASETQKTLSVKTIPMRMALWNGRKWYPNIHWKEITLCTKLNAMNTTYNFQISCYISLLAGLPNTFKAWKYEL